MPSPAPGSTNPVIPIQLLRSAVAFKRPNPEDLRDGQPAVNINSSEPGLFFTDPAKSELFKIGPCHVGDTAPNTNPALGGHVGNSVGESWLDTSNPYNTVLKVWDGEEWKTSGFLISNTIWVDPNGDDNNSGFSPQEPKKTIKNALAAAGSGSQIRVSPGIYSENNPLTFPEENVSLIGEDPSITKIVIENDQDLFYIRNGCSISNFSFEGDPVTSRSIVSFSSEEENTITVSPKILNCVNNIPNSVGVHSEGDPTSLKYRIITARNYRTRGFGGIGFKVSNKGFLNVESCETHFSQISVSALSGGTATVVNSKSLYGDFGLVSNGVSPVELSGNLQTVGPEGTVLEIGNLSPDLRPYPGQVLTVGELSFKVTGFEITNPGDGYTEVPTVTISLGTGPNPIAAQGEAVIVDGQLVDIEITDFGQGYRSTDSVTVTITGGCSTCPASAEAILTPIYYTVVNSSEVNANSVIVEISEALNFNPSPGSVVEFYRASKISAVSHYMGYVGYGESEFYEGGSLRPEHEAVRSDGGIIYFTSLDQSGNYKVGNDFTISQLTSTISGTTFTNSVLSTVTPYILSLS